MKKTLCIILSVMVILSACALGIATVSSAEAVALTVSQLPDKVYYISPDDVVDLSGAKLTVRYSDLTTKTVYVDNSKVLYAGELSQVDKVAEQTSQQGGETTNPVATAEMAVYYNRPLKTGANKVIIKYGGQKADFQVYMSTTPVKSLTVTKRPAKTEYNYGFDASADVDLSGLEIQVVYNDCGSGTSDTYTFRYNDNKNLKFMGYKFDLEFATQLVAGDNVIMVDYLNKQTSFKLYYKEIIAGDVNDDKSVDVADLVRLSRIVVNKEKLNYNKRATDLNGDGKVNQNDINILSGMLTTSKKNAVIDLDVFKVFSFKVTPDGIFYTESDPWQRNFGYNALYDSAAPYTWMYFDTFRVKFNYGKNPDGSDKEWMVQPWKGQYGMIAYGGEIGIYSKSADRLTPHYDCANDDDLVGMEMTIYKDKEVAFTRPYDKHWWITGFKLGALTDYTNMSKPHAQLIMRGTIDFQNTAMAELFAKGLADKGFSKVGFLDTTNFKKIDTYTITKNRVDFLWRDCMEKINNSEGSAS